MCHGRNWEVVTARTLSHSLTKVSVNISCVCSDSMFSAPGQVVSSRADRDTSCVQLLFCPTCPQPGKFLSCSAPLCSHRDLEHLHCKLCPTQSLRDQHPHQPSYIRQPQISSCCQTPETRAHFKTAICSYSASPAPSQVSCFSSHWLLAYPRAFRTGVNLTLFWLGGDFRNRSTTQRCRKTGKSRDSLAFLNTTTVWLPSAPL